MPKLELSNRKAGEILFIRMVDYQSNNFGDFVMTAYDDSEADDDISNPPLDSCTHESLYIKEDIVVSQYAKVKNSLYLGGKINENLSTSFTIGGEATLAPGFEISIGSTIQINNADCDN